MTIPFGVPGQLSPPKPDGMEGTAQAITAAMLMAAKSNCTCQVCQIMRGVIDKMAEPFLKPPAAQG